MKKCHMCAGEMGLTFLILHQHSSATFALGTLMSRTLQPYNTRFLIQLPILKGSKNASKNLSGKMHVCVPLCSW